MTRSAETFLYQNYNVNEKINQEELQDISSSGRVLPWKDKKLKNMFLAEAYDYVNSSKAERLRDCSENLNYQILDDESKKLILNHFCRVRLCPICSWRRTLKIFAQTNKIMKSLKNEDKYAYIFATFTIKNCEPENLSTSIDDMMNSWKKLIKYKDFKNAVKGTYRALEITHNLNKYSKYYGTFHPHFHCIFVVEKNYFTDNTIYINQEEWRKLWQRAMNLDYDPNVDVRKIHGDDVQAVSEVAKYTVKDSDYLFTENFKLTVKTVEVLDKALHKRRLVSFGGVMKQWHKKLNLDDPIDGDLSVETKFDKNEFERLFKQGKIITYAWNSGYGGYYKSY